MKKWLLLTTLLLAACSQEADVPTIKQETTIHPDVQSLVDQTTDDKFASLIYSEQGTSYLLLNTTGAIEARLEEDGESLVIQLTESDDGSPETIEDIVYAIDLHKQYDTIHLYLNGEEIAFEVWYG